MLRRQPQATHADQLRLRNVMIAAVRRPERDLHRA